MPQNAVYSIMLPSAQNDACTVYWSQHLQAACILSVINYCMQL